MPIRTTTRCRECDIPPCDAARLLMVLLRRAAHDLQELADPHSTLLPEMAQSIEPAWRFSPVAPGIHLSCAIIPFRDCRHSIPLSPGRYGDPLMENLAKTSEYYLSSHSPVHRSGSGPAISEPGRRELFHLSRTKGCSAG